MTDHKVTRRFVDVGGRAVHMRIMGNGPPALFLHSSPANSSYVVNEMAAVADTYTCFAFDTPGFGMSDALPGDTLTIAALADALAETLEAIAMPPCPVFGTHTGASIALELAVRHPERGTGLVLDGLASFSDAEFEQMFGDYFTALPPDPLGGHYSALWTRFRDQSIWFPWSARSPDALNEGDLYTPATIHRWMMMYFDAVDTYAPAYRAALSYRDGPAQVAALTLPAIFTAIERDMLHAHLDRIEPRLQTQEIRKVGDSLPDRRALTREGFDRFGSSGQHPVVSAGVRATSKVARQFVDVDDMQILVRFIGDPTGPATLIIHDVPGDSSAVELRMHAPDGKRFFLAFDLPGCGETLPIDAPDMGEIAEFLWRSCDAIGLKSVALTGTGFGSSVAIEMAASAPARTTGLTLDGVLLANETERGELRRHFAPPIAIDADGSHWFRTWQMIRDMQIWWPWFKPTRANLRRVEADFDAAWLHDCTCAAMRQPGIHVGVVNAALDQDAAARLAQYSGPVHFVANSVNTLATAFDRRAQDAFATPLSVNNGEAML